MKTENRFGHKRENGEWWIVDTASGDNIKRCPNRITAEQEAEMYNLEHQSGQMASMIGVGL